jgi:hypothetical protein
LEASDFFFDYVELDPNSFQDPSLGFNFRVICSLLGGVTTL